MSRTEFGRLVSALKKEPSKNFRLFLPGDEGHPYPFAKIVATNTKLEEIGYKPIPGYGVYIDIRLLQYARKPDCENVILVAYSFPYEGYSGSI